MKKMLLSVFILVHIGAYIRYIDDPLNSLVSFLIAGTVPGTDIVLGLWPSLAVAFCILVLAKRFTQHIRYKILEDTARQITSEKLETEFKASNDTAFDKTKRSVIAAPSVNSIV